MNVLVANSASPGLSLIASFCLGFFFAFAGGDPAQDGFGGAVGLLLILEIEIENNE